MRILHVVTGLGRASGVTTFVENVANELRAFGHEVDICTSENAERFLSPLIIKSYKVVHVHGMWLPVLHRASIQADRCGVPVVWSTHGMTAPWSLRHKWWKKCLPWFLYQKRDLKRAELVHCTAEQEERWNIALGLKRTFVVPLGAVVPARGDRERPDLKTLLFVGRVYPVKALDNLIKAFALVSENLRSGWVLRIVGPDQSGHMDELMASCDSLRIPCAKRFASDSPAPGLAGGCVMFVGPKFGAELSAEYSNCDCLALVSHTENFGATVVDAMAHGKPVLTSTGTPWCQVEARGCGWWVDNDPQTLSTAIAQMMQISPSQREEMGGRGRMFVEEAYTWSAVARRLEHQYISLAIREDSRRAD